MLVLCRIILEETCQISKIQPFMQRIFSSKTTFLLILTIGSLFLSISCSKQDDTLFELMDNDEIGVSFVNKVENREDFNIFRYRNFYNGGGVAVGDINNDGLTDIYFTSNMGSNKLYLNKGGFRFEDITDKAGVGGKGKWGTGVVMVDINNDNLLDIYVCNAGYQRGVSTENDLYINNGNNTFTESAKKYGLNENGYTTHVAFLDYDLDGDLDCYILNNSFIPVNTLNYENNRELRAENWPVKDFLKGGGDKLLKNEGGVFKDVTKEANIYSSLIGFGLGVVVGDVNDDGYPDIYISNDFYEKDYLYVNQKNGTFREELETRIKHLSMASMGADMADINNDGFQEIFTTEMLPREEFRLKTTTSFDNNYVFNLKQERGFYNQYQQNCLQLNNQDGTYSEIAHFADVAASDWSWGALMFDADNDGYNDVYVCNGLYHDVIDQDFIDFFANELAQKMALSGEKSNFDEIIKSMPSNPIPNNFFYNTKNLKFEEKAKNFGFSEPSFSNGASYADLDNDGDLDLVVNNVNQECFVYQNHTDKQSTKHNFLKINLKGEGQNTFAIGSKMEIFAQNQVFSRYLAPSRGFQSSTEYTQTIGLGNISKIDSIRITWFDSRKTLIQNPTLNKTYQISIKDAQKGSTSVQKKALNPIFEEVKLPFEANKENSFDDFYNERNLPMKLSYEGPKAAIGDINGDGREDIYICGAKGQSKVLYWQTSNGSFTKKEQKSFVDALNSEDTAAEFFDADKDGDLDLYVGSGGNEQNIGSNELMDRLYLNDGKGNFSLKNEAIPSNTMNTAVILPHDYDSDGDLDLFVGSRSYPKQYGLSPFSYIYQNNGSGVFKDITKQIAPEISKIGMLRDATWADIDGDTKKELVLVGDWMAPQIFSFKNQKFAKISTTLDKFSGFWGSIKAVDIDNDKDLDLVIGNIGENFSLKASPEAPLKLWLSDFDKNGIFDKVMSKTINGKDLPVFLKRDLAEQFPFLKAENLKHSAYANKSIQDLFDSDVLDDCEVKTVNYRKSVVAINDGKGNFEVKDLPDNVQLSCINAIAADDLNNDGLQDLILGGNFTHFMPQLGRIDACRGIVLLNQNKGNFKQISNQESGFLTDGEVKQISPIRINGKRYFINLLNNEAPKIFMLK